VVVSLLTSDQEFQLMQAADARAAGERTGLQVEVVFADNNAIQQIHQLYTFIHAPAEQRPAALVIEAVSPDGMPRLARNATRAGIAWIVQQSCDYLDAVRAQSPGVPVVSVSVNEEEIGKTQALQLKALLPGGGQVLVLQGPTDSATAGRRLAGLRTGIEGSAVEIRQVLIGDWTAKSAEAAVTSWLRLKISEGVTVDAVACQNDSMAAGARTALQALREEWTRVPFTGCDGLPEGGQRMVAKGQLAATVIKPTTTGPAVELVARTLEGHPAPPEIILGVTSHPPIEELARSRR
jgi:ABC-type sugar transport system substrate-binding protein